jgi:hypothetical protein
MALRMIWAEWWFRCQQPIPAERQNQAREIAPRHKRLMTSPSGRPNCYLKPRPVSNVTLPHWSLAIPIALIGAASWFGRRFSLRTLLIVMTLVAVTMGLVVWSVRH